MEEAATEYYGNARVERGGANVSIDFGTGGRRAIRSASVLSDRNGGAQPITSVFDRFVFAVAPNT